MRYDAFNYTLSDGSEVYFTKPGAVRYVVGADEWQVLYLQSGAVFRIELDPMSTVSYVTVIVTDGNGSESMTLTFDYSQTAWADVTELCRTLVRRTAPNSTTPATVGTQIAINFEFYDNTDSMEDSLNFNNVVAVDGLDYAYESPAAGMWPGLPDRVRIAGTLPLTFPTLNDDGETTLDAVTSGGSASFPNVGIAATFNAVGPYFALESNGTEYARTWLESVPCLDDKVVIKWWSPELGGWKHTVADVVSQGAEFGAQTMFDRDFSRHSGRTLARALRLRFPNCTLNDWMWLRDICVSDEVSIFADGFVEAGSVLSMWETVTVTPVTTDPWKIGDVKQFDIDMRAAEASSL